MYIAAGKPLRGEAARHIVGWMGGWVLVSLDVIDSILGPQRSAAVANLRSVRRELAAQMQAYYESIFEPDHDSESNFSIHERILVAIRTASHTSSYEVVAWYADQAYASGIAKEAIDHAKDKAASPVLGERMRAIMRHVDLITVRPVASRKEDIQRLLDAGLTPAGIVVLSQVVAYVSYQLRLIAAFGALGDPT